MILLISNLLLAATSGKQATTNVVTRSSINDKVNLLLDTNTSWSLRKNATLVADLTIPKTQIFSIENNAKLNIGGYTLTIKRGGKFTDSSFIGTGTIIFDTCSVDYFRQKWIGSPSLTVVFRDCNGDTLKINDLHFERFTTNELNDTSSGLLYYSNQLKNLRVWLGSMFASYNDTPGLRIPYLLLGNPGSKQAEFLSGDLKFGNDALLWGTGYGLKTYMYKIMGHNAPPAQSGRYDSIYGFEYLGVTQADIDSLVGDIKIGGNIGVGSSIVTPTSNYKSFKIGNNQIISRVNSVLEGFYINANVDFNGTTWIKPATGRSTVLDVSPLGINFYFSQNGAAGTESNNELKASLDTNGSFTTTTLNTGKINLGTSTSSVATGDSCKIFVYDNGSEQRMGFAAGQDFDFQYHSIDYHDFYLNDIRKLRITYDGLGIKKTPACALDVHGTTKIDSNVIFGSPLAGIPNRCVYSSDVEYSYSPDTAWILNSYGTNHIVSLGAGFFESGRKITVKEMGTFYTADVKVLARVNSGSWTSGFAHSINVAPARIEINVYKKNSTQIGCDIVVSNGTFVSGFFTADSDDTIELKFVVISTYTNYVYTSTLEVIDGLN